MSIPTHYRKIAVTAEGMILAAYGSQVGYYIREACGNVRKAEPTEDQEFAEMHGPAPKLTLPVPKRAEGHRLRTRAATSTSYETARSSANAREYGF